MNSYVALSILVHARFLHLPPIQCCLTIKKQVFFNFLVQGSHLCTGETRRTMFSRIVKLIGVLVLIINRHLWRIQYQEPITQSTTRSEQLPCARATEFSRNSLFLERFWREWLSFKFHKSVSKTYRYDNDIICLLPTFSFTFWYLILWLRS